MRALDTTVANLSLFLRCPPGGDVFASQVNHGVVPFQLITSESFPRGVPPNGRLPRTRLRPNQARDPVTTGGEEGDQSRADEPTGPCHENPHRQTPVAMSVRSDIV